MRNPTLWVLTSVVFVLGTPLRADSASAQGERPRFREGEVIVTFKGRVGMETMQAAAARGHAQAIVARTMAAVGRPRTVLVRFPKGVPVEEMVARLQAQPEVAAVQPNRLERRAPRPPTDSAAGMRRSFRAQGGGTTADPSRAADPGIRIAAAASSGVAYEPNDPYAYYQAGFYWMENDIIWTEKAPSPLVALIGSGVDAKAPDLAGKVVKGTDWVNADADPDDDFGLGTTLAGIVAAKANNKIGITGLSNGKILAIKALDGEGWWTEFDYAGAVLEAANNPLVKVVLIGIWGSPYESNLIKDAVQTSVTKGKLVVASVGDEQSSAPTYPGYYAHPSFPSLAPGVIAVAGTGLRSFQGCPGPGCYSYMDYSCKSLWSNYGDWVTVDAPSDGIYSTTPTHPTRGYPVLLTVGQWWSSNTGAAQVAAAAARVWSVMPAGTTAAQVKARLVSHGQDHVAQAKLLPVDTDGDGTLDTPCQPAEMSDAVVTPDFAAAMGRTAVDGFLYDAHGGLPLPISAGVTASQGGLAKGYGGTRSTDGFFRVINLPVNNATPYDLKVNAPGYTAGPVAFDSLLLDECGGDPYCGKFIGSLSLPRNLPGQTHVVTDFDGYDVDTHLFTPSSAPIHCDVGITPISSLFCFLGSLKAAPFARLLHDGGPNNSSDVRSELLSIKAPLYSTASGTPYRILLSDYGNNWIRPSGARTRIWAGGKILARVDAASGDVATNDCTYAGGANTCGAFWVGDLSGTGVFMPKAIYGVLSSGAGGVLPYAAMPGGVPLAGQR